MIKPEKGIALFAHGSSDPRWKTPFDKLAKKVAARMKKNIVVKTAFLNGCEPDIFQTVDEMVLTGLDQITIIPVFFAFGSHAEKDFPKLDQKLRQKYPEVAFEWTKAIGQWEEAIEALSRVIANRAG